MLSLYLGKEEANVEVFKFPAGESGVSFCAPTYLNGEHKTGCITLKWEGNDDLLNLCFLVDAIRRKYQNVELSLSIPYFPYARQDRVCNSGESLSVKVVASMINSLGFARVFVQDPHSEVLGAVLDNMVVLDNTYKVHKAVEQLGGNVALVSPDAGANKKVLSYAKALGGLQVVRADKSRDTKTGSITGTVVYSEHLGNTNLLVVDDIADGAGTFIPLAKELRKITDGTVNLFVTHGIFTKGVDVVGECYDNIFTANNMFGTHSLIKEI